MVLTGKVVIVTGGAGLLGQQFIEAIAGSGGVAVIADIDDVNGERVREELSRKQAGRIEYVPIEITSRVSIKNALQVAHDKYGRVDAIVNNAYPRNKNYGKSFFEVEYTDFCENVGLHLGGYFLVCQEAARYFKNQGIGNIVNISSVYGVISPRFEVYEGTEMTMPVEYAVIKSALIHLTKYIAKFLKGTDIRVNSISPGGVLAGQPQSFLDRYNSLCLTKGMLDKADISGTLIYLLSDLSKYVNGQNIIIDDGYSL